LDWECEDEPKKQPSMRKKVLKGKNKYWIKKEKKVGT
jgi:hypothetical protein